MNTYWWAPIAIAVGVMVLIVGLEWRRHRQGKGD